MSMKILIVEDDPIYTSALEVMIENMGYTLAASTDNSNEVLRLTQAVKPDLILLDIYLQGDLTGVQIAEEMQALGLATPIIFITSMRDQETFEAAKKTSPFAYITKPIEADALQRAIELAIQRHNSKATYSPNWQKNVVLNNSFFIKNGSHFQKIEIPSIHYVEVQNKHSIIATQEEQFKVRMPLKELTKKLPDKMFMKIHQSYLVNISQITSIDTVTDQVQVGKYIIPTSRRYKSKILGTLGQI